MRTVAYLLLLFGYWDCGCWYPTAHNDTNMNDETTNDWKFPLLLSCLAGASTCVGAAIVFVLEPSTIQQHMSFSLSLAASVMITVSVVSILPECCWDGVLVVLNEGGEGESGVVTKTIDVALLIERVCSFALGCGIYAFLKQVIFRELPDPEDLWIQQHQTGSSNSSSSGGDDFQVSSKHDDPIPQARLLFGKDNDEDDNDDDNDDEEQNVALIHPTKLIMEKQNDKNASTIRRKQSQPQVSPLFHRSSNNVDNDDEYDDDLQRRRRRRKQEQHQRSSSWRVTMLLFVSLLVHNFPEGLAVVASTVESNELGITVAVGIFVHNIPEGIAVAVPCMVAKPDSPWLAFALASGSGIAEPLGALVALWILQTQETMIPLENVLAFVAGIMCTVSCLELYPEALQQLPSTTTAAAAAAASAALSPSTTIVASLPSTPTSSPKQKQQQIIFVNPHHRFRPIVTGTLLGIVIMVATEWYLP